MNKNHQGHIAQFCAQGRIVEAYVLVVIAYSERETKQVGPYKGRHETGCGIDPAAVFENIDAKAKQKRQEKEQTLVAGERKKKDEKNVQIRIDITRKIDVIKDQNLQEDQNYKSADI